MAKKAMLLVIEDNPADVFFIKQALGDYRERLQIIEAADGLEGLNILKLSKPPELILLDLNLPRVDGFAVLEACQPGNIPVVVFSSSQNPREIERARKLGARDFVQKPSNLDKFTETVQNIVQRYCVIESHT